MNEFQESVREQVFVVAILSRRWFRSGAFFDSTSQRRRKRAACLIFPILPRAFGLSPTPAGEEEGKARRKILASRGQMPQK